MTYNLQLFGGRGAGSGESDYLGKKQGGGYSPDEAIRRVNPKYNSGDRAYKINCQKCVLAYEMQRRGYDVEAVGNFTGTDGYFNVWGKAFDGLDRAKVSFDDGKRRTTDRLMNDIQTAMSKEGSSSRWIVRVGWTKTEGHVFNAEYHNGVVSYFDAQTGRRINGSNYFDLCIKKGTWIARVDNLSVNHSEMSKFVKKRGK